MSASALEGVRVLDCATLFAGPTVAQLLGDYGARVIKVEHPRRPDATRGHGRSKDGHNLWWKVLGRNKETITTDLSSESGKAVFLRLVQDTDVVIESFRPGTLEKWGLDWDTLRAVNPGLVLLRISGFGQFGPRRRDAGFGTLAEAMSGFAAQTGEPDGPPILPPFALADGVAGLAGAYAVMLALHARSVSGEGQVIDLALIEPLLSLLGPQVTVFDQLGVKPERNGNRSSNNAPRNIYQASDGKWLAVSTSGQVIAERVMHLVGHPEFIDEPWFASGAGRASHVEELDLAVSRWVSRRSGAEALAAFQEAEAAATLVYDVEDIMNDTQYAALGTIVEVDDPDLGPMKMLNVPFRMGSTPGEIRATGRGHGADTDRILTELGYSPVDIAAFRAEGAI